MEKFRDRYRRLITLKPRYKGAGVNRLSTETPDPEEEGCITKKYITLRYELEKASMEEIGNMSRLPEKYMPML